MLGLIASPAAVAAYLLGDRLKVMVAAAFQPFVQGLYLVRCRQSGQEIDRSLLVSVIVVLCAAVGSGIVLSWNAGQLNQILYGSKYPDEHSLALFVIAGHVSVVASLGYFLVLIPSGRTPVFIKMVVGQVLIFVAMLFLLSPDAPVGGPAIAILVAESFLLFAVAMSILVMVIRARRHVAHTRV
jgi:O-antigen/teichoic acid export membrane protein